MKNLRIFEFKDTPVRTIELQGVPTSERLDLRPQHNAPTLHNSQVRQTMYVRQFHAPQLAARLGLAAVPAPPDTRNTRAAPGTSDGEALWDGDQP